MTTDPRIAPVEDNLLSFLGGVAELDMFEVDPGDDVVAYHSSVPFPLFNAVSGARFGDHPARRGRVVVERYLDRGLPFLWWTTPSTTSPQLEQVLAEAGMAREETPGMHVPLSGPVSARLPAGVELRVVGADEPHPFVSTMMAGFDFPAELTAPMVALMTSYPQDDLVNVLATVHGRPAAVGSAWITGDTVGLYNIATLEWCRRRGLGRAVTAALMDHGRERGATQAVLHATAAGRPTYERLGFVEVCRVPQYVWLPGT